MRRSFKTEMLRVGDVHEGGDDDEAKDPKSGQVELTERGRGEWFAGEAWSAKS